MHIHHDQLEVRTHGKGLYEITDEVQSKIDRSGVQTGTVTVFVQHTSCSVVIMENADPTARRDLEEFFDRLVPEDAALLHAQLRGQRRHAFAYPHGTDAHQRNRADSRWKNAARHMAGHFPLRTSPRRAPPESFYHHDRQMSVLHCPEIFAIATVAGVTDPRLPAADSHFGLAHPFQLKGKSLTATCIGWKATHKKLSPRASPLAKVLRAPCAVNS